MWKDLLVAEVLEVDRMDDRRVYWMAGEFNLSEARTPTRDLTRRDLTRRSTPKRFEHSPTKHHFHR